MVASSWIRVGLVGSMMQVRCSCHAIILFLQETRWKGVGVDLWYQYVWIRPSRGRERERVGVMISLKESGWETQCPLINPEQQRLSWLDLARRRLKHKTAEWKLVWFITCHNPKSKEWKHVRSGRKELTRNTNSGTIQTNEYTRDIDGSGNN